jgi:hypothetical protein
MMPGGKFMELPDWFLPTRFNCSFMGPEDLSRSYMGSYKALRAPAEVNRQSEASQKNDTNL